MPCAAGATAHVPIALRREPTSPLGHEERNPSSRRGNHIPTLHAAGAHLHTRTAKRFARSTVEVAGDRQQRDDQNQQRVLSTSRPVDAGSQLVMHPHLRVYFRSSCMTRTAHDTLALALRDRRRRDGAVTTRQTSKAHRGKPDHCGRVAIRSGSPQRPFSSAAFGSAVARTRHERGQCGRSPGSCAALRIRQDDRHFSCVYEFLPNGMRSWTRRLRTTISCCRVASSTGARRPRASPFGTR